MIVWSAKVVTSNVNGILKDMTSTLKLTFSGVGQKIPNVLKGPLYLEIKKKKKLVESMHIGVVWVKLSPMSKSDLKYKCERVRFLVIERVTFFIQWKLAFIESMGDWLLVVLVYMACAYWVCRDPLFRVHVN